MKLGTKARDNCKAFQCHTGVKHSRIQGLSNSTEEHTFDLLFLGLWKVTSESDKENIHLSTRGKTAIWNYFFTQGGKILHGISVGKNNGLFGKGKECIEKEKQSEMGSHTLESR